MASNWNFRTILEVDPASDSFTCVSTKPDNSSRCQNRRPLLSDLDLAQAGQILDAMDQCDSLKTSYEYLDDLARLTLCIIHAEAGRDHVAQISGGWKQKIMDHMKTEVGNSSRPKTRRSIGRRRTSSTAAVMTVLKEEKEEQSPATAKKTEEIWKASLARTNTSQSRPTRNMSRKISTLISEVGFQDATNEKFVETPQEPTRTPPVPPPRRLPLRTKTQYPPITRSDEWSSYPLLSLLTRSSTLLKSDQQIEDQSAEVIAKQIQASRERANTASSTGSSTSGSKGFSTDSESGSSAPTSRSSSTKNSPVLGSEKKQTPFPPLTIPPPTIAAGPLSSSPEQVPLPTFDFGIFQSLPLPPGHKQSISNDKELTPVSGKNMWTDGSEVKAPPRLFEYDQSRPSFALQGLEKPASRRQSEAVVPAESAIVEEIAQDPESLETEEVDTTENLQPSEDELLPECDTVSMIGTSWIKSSRLSRSSSMHSSRNASPSPPISRTSSFSLSRTASLSRKPSLSRSSSATRKPARTSSFSLSRTLSRSLSRRSSKTSPKVDGEMAPNTQPTARRATDSANRGSMLVTKDDGVPLNRLIQMSHDLARRLDGIETTGYAKVAPTTSYKYRLPSAAVRNAEKNPEMRFSKLFMGLNSDMNSFPYVSSNFPFSIPIPRKPVADYEDVDRRTVIAGRSQSVGNNDPTPREIEVFVRPAVVPRPVIRKLTHEGMQVKIPTIRKLTHEGMQVQQLAVPPKPVTEVEVCAMCGNTQTIWGRCDCGTPGSAKGKVGSMPKPKVVLGKMERRPTKRVPKRGSTLRRIRKRVVRAFSI